MSFKTPVSESADQYAPVKVGDGSTTETSNVEVPFTDYRASNKMPYTAKYFGVEHVWDSKEMESDINDIEEYLNDIVNKGELSNDVKVVEKKLKSIEKMANIDQFESKGERLLKLSTFIQYLRTLERRKNERYI